MGDLGTLLVQSYVIGFTAAATLGPIALVCIQRTLRYGWRVGLASGFGVALADGVYGLVGALGLNALSSLLLENQRLLGWVGGVVLVSLGLRAFRSTSEMPQQDRIEESYSAGLPGAAGSIFLLTLSNPITIMFFSAVYAGLTIGGNGLAGSVSAGFGFFTVGVFAGSFSWWVILVTAIYFIRQRFQLSQILWLNRASGLVIAGFGIWVLLQQVSR